MTPQFKPSALLAALSLIPIAGCTHEQVRKASGMVWHTEYHVTYESNKNLNDSIISVFDKVGSSLNAFDDASLISELNRSASVKADRALADVYKESVRVNNITEGAFDPTLGPLITAWGFGKSHKATSDTLHIDSLMSITGIKKTHISNGILVKEDKRIQFNFSAIAKGYGCDEVCRMLMRNGATNVLVEIGGDITCHGKSPSGGKWRVSVDRPILTDSVVHESQCIIEITDSGIATSGNYRNHRTTATGEVYGHTISAKTGRPALTDVLSATVVAPTCMEADALSTSLMTMGSINAKKLATRLRYPVMLVLNDMSVWQTEEFSELTVS